MTPNPLILKSIEQLNYRVTVGDVATNTGLELNQAQQGLLALASDAGGHLQVADTGDLVYLFPKNFQAILRNKFWKLRFQEWWQGIWKILFYLIRISFGMMLIASIIIMVIAIALIFIALSSKDDNNSGGGGGSSSNSRGGGINFFFFPRIWNIYDLFWIFSPDYNYYQRQQLPKKAFESEKSEMNFLEAIFSFLFGDGNPNYNLEERRWQSIGAVIRNHQGAVIAQQIAPYLDNIDADEDYMLPVLTRFNGYPEVSPEGEIIYYFPELQVTAKGQRQQAVASYLHEQNWRFSEATSGQKFGAVSLGIVNIVLAVVLGVMLQGDIAAELGGFVAFVSSIYGLLIAYAVSFLSIPFIRYLLLAGKNKKIEQRNYKRQNQAKLLAEADSSLIVKINYARQFATEKVITEGDLAYSTERDLLQQELESSDKIDQEWQKRLGN